MRIIHVPTSLGGLKRATGAEHAPEKVMACMKQLYLSEEGRHPVLHEEKIEVVEGNLEATQEAIYTYAKKTRLPTEAEWELASASAAIEGGFVDTLLASARAIHPAGAMDPDAPMQSRVVAGGQHGVVWVEELVAAHP